LQPGDLAPAGELVVRLDLDVGLRAGGHGVEARNLQAGAAVLDLLARCVGGGGIGPRQPPPRSRPPRPPPAPVPLGPLLFVAHLPAPSSVVRGPLQASRRNGPRTTDHGHAYFFSSSRRTPASLSAASCLVFASSESGLPARKRRRYGAQRRSPLAS